MGFKPFRIPETRLIVIGDLVVQVTLSFRTHEDEELRNLYNGNEEIQSLLQTAVVSLVNYGYTNGNAKGPGFVLHQTRKKWPIGKRYVFTQNGEPLQSSPFKYFFQVELVRDAELEGSEPYLEIAEMRGVMFSPTPSSYAGSVIDGLDAMTLPPSESFMEDASPYSAQSSVFHSPPSAFSQPEHSRRLSGSNAGSSAGNRRVSLLSLSGAINHEVDSPSSHIRGAPESIYREPDTDYYRSLGSRTSDISPLVAAARISNADLDSQIGILDSARPDSSCTTRTRSVSHASMESIIEPKPLVPLDKPQSQQQLARSPAELAAAIPSPTNTTPSLKIPHISGTCTWKRPLHGISPLSRQPKSLSSTDHEWSFEDDKGDAGSRNTPRIARPAVGRGSTSGESTSRPPQPASPSVNTHYLNELTSKLKRKILTPINLRKSSVPYHRRFSAANILRESPIPEVDSDEINSSEFTGIGSNSHSDISDSARSGSYTNKNSDTNLTPPLVNDGDIYVTSNSSTIGDTPSQSQQQQQQLPSRIPRMSGSNLSHVAKKRQSFSSTVKDALMRRLRLPLSGHPDKRPQSPSVMDRIAKYNKLDQNASDSVKRPSFLKKPVTNSVRSKIPKLSKSNGDGFKIPVLQNPAPVEAKTLDVKSRQLDEYASPIIPGARTRVGAESGLSGASVQTTADVLTGLYTRAVLSPRTLPAADRPVSPALSQSSAVSSRIKDAVNFFESPNRQNNQGSGAPKRGLAGSGSDYCITSPSKRYRADSGAAQSVAGSDLSVGSGSIGRSRADSLGVVQRMIHRNKN